jgi:hypothetical protein
MMMMMVVMMMQEITLTFIGATNHAAGEETRARGRKRSRPDLSTAAAKGKGGEKTSMEDGFDDEWAPPCANFKLAPPFL